MANRRSWRRPATPQPANLSTRLSTPAVVSTPQIPSKPAADPAPTFAGVSDVAMSKVLALLYAKEVTMRVIDGSEYVGLFAGTERPNAATELCLVLRYARIVRPGTHAAIVEPRAGFARIVRVPVSRVIALQSARLEFDAPRHRSDSRAAEKTTFATDTEISRGTSGIGRKLQRFDDFGTAGEENSAKVVPRSVDEQTFGELATTINGSRHGKKWDQFQVNEVKFGVRTSFDEDEYTTKIDRNDANFAERQREAARLALEIERKASDNVHLREERNQDLGADIDEEAMYSGVQRPVTAVPAVTETATSQAVPEATTMVPKPTIVEKPKLSYAAAAASSVRSAIVVGAPGSVSVPGAVRHASVSKQGLPSKPAVVSKPAAASKQTTAPKQGTVPKHTGPKQGAGLKQAQGQKQTVATKQGLPAKSPLSGKQTFVGKQPVASKHPSVTKAQSMNKQQSTGKHAVVGKQFVSRQAVSTKQPIASKQTPASKQIASSKPVQTSKPAVGAHIAAGSGPAPYSNKQTSYSSAVSASILESREREVIEKKSKLSGRERSSRENLPQLVKVRTSITGRTSPNQSRNSPLPTPAAADTSAVGVLNLDAQTPNFGPEQIKRFEEYKTKREFKSIAENREKITDDLKKFSTQLDSRNGPLRRGVVTSTTNSTTNSGTTVSEKKTPDVAKVEEKQKQVTKTDETSAEEKETATAFTENASEASGGSKVKPKSKLNPNAMEFNPDAFKFEPPMQVQAPMNSAPQAYNPYPVGVVPAEYSQAMQSAHVGYHVPMQAMGQIPYGQPPYGVILPGAIPSGMHTNNSAYHFIQGPNGAFPATQVAASRFAQNGGMSASYAYPQMNPTVPVVLASGPQRIPSGHYPYYSSGPFTGQIPGAPQMSQPPQQAVYASSGQPGIVHMQSLGMAGRGGHGHPRRGGTGRRGGKHHTQHSHGLQPNGVNSTDKNASRQQAQERPVSSDLGQR